MFFSVNNKAKCEKNFSLNLCLKEIVLAIFNYFGNSFHSLGPR